MCSFEPPPRFTRHLFAWIQKGKENTAVGHLALFNNSAHGDAIRNTAVGALSLEFNDVGSNSTAVGFFALGRITDGNENIAVGSRAGEALTQGSDNIYVGHKGQSTEFNTIRLGTQGTQAKAFVAGVSGASVSGTPVVVDANGQLGVAPSSRRFKHDIQTMGAGSDGLFRLRPVTFHYTSSVAGDTERLHYGLIAEEVAKVFPNLVPLDADGHPQTVLYEELAPMLVNELQKEVNRRRELEAELARDRELLQMLQTRVEELASRLPPIATRIPASCDNAGRAGRNPADREDSFGL